MNTAEVATPELLLTAVFTPPANVPDAPLLGAVKVTVTPLTGLPPASFTVTCRRSENAVLIAVLCESPFETLIEAGGPAVLVNEKLADFETPATFAVTI